MGLAILLVSLPSGAFATLTFRNPLDAGGWRQTQDFGCWSSTWGGYHLGEDYVVNDGAELPVYAAADGRVKHGMSHTGYGYVVIIEHDLGEGLKVCSVYGHMRRSGLIGVGGTLDIVVAKGQLIGYLSRDSEENGGYDFTHLHFGVRSGPYSSALDPDGKWRYRGYASSEAIRDLWYDPTDFITAHQGGQTQEKAVVTATDALPWFAKGSCTGHPEYWKTYTYSGHTYIYTYVGGLVSDPSKPDCWAKLRPYVFRPGTYDVYARFYADPESSTKVPYTVYYGGGSATVRVNQYSGSWWTWREVKLGTWDFPAGGEACVMVTDATGEPFDNTTTFNVDTIAFVYQGGDSLPVVEAFGVAPDTVTLGDSFTISYTVSDDVGLKQTELWRANDVGGVPQWPDEPIKVTSLSGQTSYSGSFADAPTTPGVYWYGLHVLDDHDWNDEQNSKTGGLPGKFGPISVEVLRPTGSLTVTINPSEVRGSARWRLTSGPDTTWKQSGETIPSIPVGGPYTLIFSDVSGWGKPDDTSVSIAEGSNSQTGIYRDIEPPVINLLGDDPMFLEVGTPYREPGYAAWDNYDGNITTEVSVTGSVNHDVLGTYILTYNVSDSSGNPAEERTRKVKVVDTTAPVITLLGDNPMTLEVGTPYVEPGYVATDNYDGDLGQDVAVTGSVEHTSPDVYIVRYNVTDSSGNPAEEKTRTVNVVQIVPFDIFEIVQPLPGTIRLTWSSRPGVSYSIWSCVDLPSSAWEIESVVSSQGEITEWTDPAPEGQVKFYRVEIK